MRELDWGLILAAIGTGVAVGSFLTNLWHKRREQARERPVLRVYVDGISQRTSGGRHLIFGIYTRNAPAVLKKVQTRLWWKTTGWWGQTRREEVVSEEDQVMEDKPVFVHVPLSKEGNPAAWAMKIFYTDLSEVSRWKDRINKTAFQKNPL